jgi:hypothetical protein
MIVKNVLRDPEYFHQLPFEICLFYWPAANAIYAEYVGSTTMALMPHTSTTFASTKTVDLPCGRARFGKAGKFLNDAGRVPKDTRVDRQWVIPNGSWGADTCLIPRCRCRC